MSDATGSFSSNKTDTSLPLIIVNPTSAGGDTARIWAKTASEVHRRFGAFAVEFTRAPGHGKQIAHEAAKQRRSLIIACGGDGTINEVANGILESGESAELGILPSGTGGDFRRSFNISINPAQAASDLKNGKTETIDAGRVTFVDENGESVSRYFLGVASFGISTSVINRVKADKPFAWLPRAISGRAGFAWSTLQTTLEMKYTRALVTLDEGREREVSIVNFCVANARYFGGGMKIAPDAKLDDGLFDVVMIGEISSAKILANSYKLYAGTHSDVAEVHHAHAQKVVIKPIADEKIRFETDGELPGFLPAVFEIAPRALKIRIPKK
ncbi:MAG TPA: diacylglycerol kinase family protein [Pyrinomonadaceae bacterium]|nr:diacylglycerol kinase family protein [Pyrinomonadaceae bacterium]